MSIEEIKLLLTTKFGEQAVVSYVKDDKPARFGVDAKGKHIDETLRDLTKTVPLDRVLIVNSQSPLTAAELKLIKAK